MKCHQCSNAPLYSVGEQGIPLCLSCYSEVQRIENDRLQFLHKMMSQADDMIYQTIGFDPRPKPMMVENKGGITLNNFNITDNNIGVLGVGCTQLKDIDISINTLSQSSKNEIADALRELTQRIIDEQDMRAKDKELSIQLISLLAEEANKPKEQRKSLVLKDVISQLADIITVVDRLKPIAERYLPILISFFAS